VGEGYPRQKVRWSGSFGSAFLYFVVPRVILFREEHTTRTLVPKVDFVSAPGISAPDVYRPGGPHALVTGRCLFMFDRARARFRLESVHEGHSVAEIREHTGFEFDCPAEVPVTPPPEPEVLALLRGDVAALVADPYPQFAARLWGVGRAA
jgi:glutaconate CoA-transferase subunit B